MTKTSEKYLKLDSKIRPKGQQDLLKTQSPHLWNEGKLTTS